MIRGVNKRVMAGAALAALLALAGCDNGPSAVETRDRDGETALAAAPVEAAPSATQTATAPDASAGFTANRQASSQQRAEQLFERNGAAFAARSVEDFAAKARAFVDNPPAGVETIRRGNGDTLYYHPATNTFAVATRDGAPRTMFKPDDGAAYWDLQKTREAARAPRG